MDAYQVKKQITRELRAKNQFVSAGVMQKGGEEYVMVHIRAEDFEQVCRSIPTQVEGIEIRVARSGGIFAL